MDDKSKKGSNPTEGSGTISEIRRKKKIRQKIVMAFLIICAIFSLTIAVKKIWLTPKIHNESITKMNADLTGKLVSKINVIPDSLSHNYEVELKGGGRYKTSGPGMDLREIQLVQSNGAELTFDRPKFNYQLIPSYLILLLFLMSIILSSGISTGKIFKKKDDKSTTKFSDIAGNKEAKEALTQVVQYLKDPDVFECLGARFPRGIILDGPPGTGKTLLGRAVAGEADAHFISCSGSDFNSMYVGVSGMKIKSFFAKARRNAPCVVFIDEIDAIGGKRLEEGSAVAREMGSTLNQLLVQMDGFEPNNGVIVIAATNRIELLDPALLRSGRFDRKIHVQLPTLSEREDILRIHGSGLNANEFSFQSVARSCIGMSGADMENLLNQAALIAVHEGSGAVTTTHAMTARDRMMMGDARTAQGKSFDDRTRKILAAHEAGHAIVGMVSGPDPVTRVSIVPRGQSLGQTITTPDGERMLHEKAALLNHVEMLLGGRAAEMLVTDTQTTGASDDLSRASELIHEMICTYGMHNGLLRVTTNSSDSMRFRAECESSQLLDECMVNASDIIKANRIIFDEMVAELVLNEEISENSMVDFTQRIGRKIH